MVSERSENRHSRRSQSHLTPLSSEHPWTSA